MKWRVRDLAFASGERFVALVDARTGIPDFEVARYTLTQLRPRNLATGTIAAATRAIKFGLEVLDLLDVDVDQRIKEVRLLALNEVDRLVELFSWTQESLYEALQSRGTLPESKKVLSLESVRKRAQTRNAPDVINSKTASVRLMYFRDFLAWKVDCRLYSTNLSENKRDALRDARDSLEKWITARLPKARNYNSEDAPQGLLPEEIEQLLAMVDLDSPMNPWVSEAAKVRNKLAIQTLLNLGLRKGELLSLKVTDIDFRQNELKVVRRPNDPEDVRKLKPNVKTRARILALDPELSRGLHQYVVKHRAKHPGAKYHPYLFVANGTGKPLSISAINKIFIELKEGALSAFERLTPHLLRHSWNDRFSELMDDKGVNEDLEQQERSYAMGWTPGSETAQKYTRRFVRKKANQASLQMQSRLNKLNAD